MIPTKDMERVLAMQLRKKLAFTLIELLVVISIISLLMAILLPSLNKAKEQAKRIKCMANLKSIGHSLHLYANNYDGRLIPGDFWGAWDVWAKVTEYPVGCTIPPNIEYREVNLGHLFSSNILSVPTDNDHVFFCPSHRPKDEKRPFDHFSEQWGRTSNDTRAPISYMFNNALDGFNDYIQEGDITLLAHKDKINFLMGNGSVHSFNVKPLVYEEAVGPEMLDELMARFYISFPPSMIHRWFKNDYVNLDEANEYLTDPQGWVQDHSTLDSSGRAVSKPLLLANISENSLVSDATGVLGTAPLPSPG